MADHMDVCTVPDVDGTSTCTDDDEEQVTPVFKGTTFPTHNREFRKIETIFREIFDNTTFTKSERPNIKSSINKLAGDHLEVNCIGDLKRFVKHIEEKFKSATRHNVKNKIRHVRLLLDNSTLDHRREMLKMPDADEEEVNDIFNRIIPVYGKKTDELKQQEKNARFKQATPHERRNYMPYEELYPALLEKLDEITPENVRTVHSQMLIGASILLGGSKMRRLNIGETKAMDFGANMKLLLSDYIIKIKKCNKSKEKPTDYDHNVEIVIEDEKIMEKLKLLADTRNADSDHYFFKRDMINQETNDYAPDCAWFGVRLSKTLEREFGKKLTVGMLRIICGKYLSKTMDNGDPRKQEEIAEIMGHAYKTHQEHYNIEGLEV
ncbi:hypothetical protein BC832DRAFT_588528 [Gaertneriomyces semiglobifer]|nr:hypothetical protein BC832DRAFT_588528 [Gaertneriomyces semiglobifer]